MMSDQPYPAHDAELMSAPPSALHHGDLSPHTDTVTELKRNISRIERLQLEERAALPSPISTLLPELLSMIFFMYAEDNFELFNLRWTRLLLVCHYWHDVAIRSPELWSYIELLDVRVMFTEDAPILSEDEMDARDLRRVALQKIRARSWPLTVRLEMYSKLSTRREARIYMLWGFASLSSLSLRGSTLNLEKILRFLESHQHSGLKNLVITSHERHRPGTLPDIVLGGNTPHLQNLTVSGMTFSWTSIRDLRSLRIHYTKWFQMGHSLPDILDALDRCPLLEHLHVVLPGTFRPEPLPARNPISLLHIKLISLRGSDEMCGNILNALRGLSHSTKITISIYDEVEDPSPLTPPASFSLLAKHASHIDAPHIGAIGLVKQRRNLPRNPDNLCQFGLTGDLAMNTSISGPAMSDAGSTHLTSYVAASTTTRGDAELGTLCHILRQWPLAHVTHLDVRTSKDAEVTADMWGALFANLPALTTVLVRPEAEASASLFDVLDARLRDSEERLVKNIVLDLTWVGEHTRTEGYRQESVAREVMGRVQPYCAEAAGANAPVDIVEVVNDKNGHFALIDCGEFSKYLAQGFIYRGTLYQDGGKNVLLG